MFAWPACKHAETVRVSIDERLRSQLGEIKEPTNMGSLSKGYFFAEVLSLCALSVCSWAVLECF